MMRVLALCAFAALLASPAFADLSRVGDVKLADETTTEVSKVAEFAVQQINSQTNSKFAMILSSVVKASKQTVAGMKYKLVVEVLSSTDCQNDGKRHTLCSCSADTSKPTRYQAVVLVQPWRTPSMQLVSFNQVGHDSPDSIDGVSKTKPLTIASAINASSARFQRFLKKYTPSYCHNAVELNKRSRIFEDNMHRIANMQGSEQSNADYGVSRFADMTMDEIHTRIAIPVRRFRRATKAGPLSV